jgi:hypothetical protein
MIINNKLKESYLNSLRNNLMLITQPVTTSTIHSTLNVNNIILAKLGTL